MSVLIFHTDENVNKSDYYYSIFLFISNQWEYVIVTSFSLFALLWRSRYFYDRRTEEILQCNEKVGFKETTKAYTTTSSKNKNFVFLHLFKKCFSYALG